MALDTYDNLFKAISNRIERGTSLDLEIPDFILLAEKEMLSNPSESLKISEAETISTAPTSTTDRYLALPDGFKKGRDFTITLDNGIGRLEYRTPSQLQVRNGTGTPWFFTIKGNELEFDIVPAEAWTVTFSYFKDFAPLTKLNQTNIILDKHPNIYLFGALRHAFIRAQDLQQEAIYSKNFIVAIEAANASELEARNGINPQQTQHWCP